MPTVNERLSNIEAVQHFELAVLGAVSKVCQADPKFAELVRENLTRTHAVLLGESLDEIRLRAFVELMDEWLGKPNPC